MAQQRGADFHPHRSGILAQKAFFNDIGVAPMFHAFENFNIARQVVRMCEILPVSAHQFFVVIADDFAKALVGIDNVARKVCQYDANDEFVGDGANIVLQDILDIFLAG